MTNTHVRRRDSRASPAPALRPLVAALTLALSASASSTESAPSGAVQPAPLAERATHRLSMRAAPSVTSATTHFVTTCDDAPVQPTCDGQDDGTLRKAFDCARNGDAIDLTQLQCSKITLTAALTSGPVTLALLGPGQDKLTIDGAGKFRVLVHNGRSYDGLYVNGLTITNGRYDNPYDYGGGGGCIFSSGNVTVNYSAVSSCYASAPQGVATGGAIYAKGIARLYRTSVTGSTASGGAYGIATGGGIYANTVALNRSTISGNAAKSQSLALAGGIQAQTALVDYSTVAGNSSYGVGGIFANSVSIHDSTISGNHVLYGPFGGVYARDSAQVINSTIANNSSAGDSAAGLYVRNSSAPSTTVQNTIIANNTAGGIEIDAGTDTGLALPGSDNIIMAAQAGTALPPDTNPADPKLGPLQDNGGPTQTMALKPGSPAINTGGASGLASDQRGVPRVIGSKPDIGAFEFDPDSVFVNGFN